MVDDAVEKIGADPMRWFYMRQNPAENANFGYNTTEEVKRKLLILYNVYTFFETYVKNQDLPRDLKVKPKNILDQWVVSKANHLISVTEFNLDKYDVAKATLEIENFFINDLSLWYLRRSRKRFHSSSLGSSEQASPPDGSEQVDRKEAVETLYYILLVLSKLISPIAPFFAEKMYQGLKSDKMPESVHLSKWPEAEGQTDLELEQKMDEVRSIVSLALAERSAKGIKVRQPLSVLKVKNQKSKVRDHDELLALVKDEVNVKDVVFDGSIKETVQLDTAITKELKEEGIVREMVRFVQDLRKEQGLKPEDIISVWFLGLKTIDQILEKNKDFLSREVRAKEIMVGKKVEGAKEVKIENEKYYIKIEKIHPVK